MDRLTVEVLVSMERVTIAQADRAIRVLETASPPTVYVPPDAVAHEYLQIAPGRSLCEWKGAADYFDVVVGDQRIAKAGWCYPSPSAPFAELAGWLSFYPSKLACWYAGERARPQGGGFYGGWVTDQIVGPWKGSTPTSGSW